MGQKTSSLSNPTGAPRSRSKSAVPPPRPHSSPKPIAESPGSAGGEARNSSWSASRRRRRSPPRRPLKELLSASFTESEKYTQRVVSSPRSPPQLHDRLPVWAWASRRSPWNSGRKYGAPWGSSSTRTAAPSSIYSVAGDKSPTLSGTSFDKISGSSLWAAVAGDHRDRQQDEQNAHGGEEGGAALAWQSDGTDALPSSVPSSRGDGPLPQPAAAAPSADGGLDPGLLPPAPNPPSAISVLTDSGDVAEGSLKHDEDWIQVSDSEGEDVTPSPRGRGGRHHRNLSVSTSHGRPTSGSYNFTDCGSVTLDGFAWDLTEMGMNKDCREVDVPTCLLTARERLVPIFKLGSGASGKVYKVFDLVELRFCALKVAPVFDAGKLRQIVQELTALQETSRKRRERGRGVKQAGAPLDEDCVVEFYDAFASKEQGSVSLLVEYMDGGSLEDVVNNGGLKCEQTLASVAQQCLQGLRYLHSCHQIHRDIKPANILFNRKGEVKLSDFGIATSLQQMEGATSSAARSAGSSSGGGSSTSTVASLEAITGRQLFVSKEENVATTPLPPPPKYETLDLLRRKPKKTIGESHPGNTSARLQLKGTRTFVGTLTYMSPERINGQVYGFPSDIWSVGLALLTLAQGQQPFDRRDGYWSVLHCIRDNEPPVLPSTEAWSENFRNFLAQCLNKDPIKRLGCDDLLAHDFITRGGGERELSGGIEAAKAGLAAHVKHQGLEPKGYRNGGVAGVNHHSKQSVISLLRSVASHVCQLGSSEEGKRACAELIRFAEGGGSGGSLGDGGGGGAYSGGGLSLEAELELGSSRISRTCRVMRALFCSPGARNRLDRLAEQFYLDPEVLRQTCRDCIDLMAEERESYLLAGEGEMLEATRSDAEKRGGNVPPPAVAPPADSSPSVTAMGRATRKSTTIRRLSDLKLRGTPQPLDIKVLDGPRSPAGALPAGKVSPMG